MTAAGLFFLAGRRLGNPGVRMVIMRDICSTMMGVFFGVGVRRGDVRESERCSARRED